MEKIALKNTQQGSPNTYEIATGVIQQLIASTARYNEIKGGAYVSYLITSQEKQESYTLPITIIVTNVVLYFSNGNGQNMRLTFASGSFDENFVAPFGAGVVTFNDISVQILDGDNQIMDVYNLDEPSTAPDPVLSSWCFTYEIP